MISILDVGLSIIVLYSYVPVSGCHLTPTPFLHLPIFANRTKFFTSYLVLPLFSLTRTNCSLQNSQAVSCVLNSGNLK